MTDSPASGLGAELRAARQAQGWELPQLAASLRIRQSYLEAIEAGNLAALPGTTYALGFVRAYASALGLPGEDMARRFRADSTLANGQTALRFPAPVPQRGVPAGALMLLGVVILAGAYGGWYWVTEHRATPVEMVPPIPDRMVSEGQDTIAVAAGGFAAAGDGTTRRGTAGWPAGVAGHGKRYGPQRTRWRLRRLRHHRRRQARHRRRQCRRPSRQRPKPRRQPSRTRHSQLRRRSLHPRRASPPRLTRRRPRLPQRSRRAHAW